MLLASLLLVATAPRADSHVELASPAYDEGLQAVRRLDFGTALEMWRPLAERGDPHAQLQLALLYDRGDGVARNPEEALHWLREAAEAGLALAQFALAERYAGIHQGPKIPARAYYWYARAAEQRFPTAELRRSEWAPRLSARVRQTVDAELARRPVRAARPAVSAAARPAPAPSPVRAPAAPASESARAPEPDPVAPFPASHAPARGDLEVQLASLRSEDEARSEWRRLRRSHGDVLDAYPHRIARVELPGRGTFYRVRLQGLPDTAEATSLCKTLEARRVPCLPSTRIPGP